MKLGISIFFFFLLGAVHAQDCSILKNNSFTYRAAKDDVLVEFKGNQYIEHHQNKKYVIKSKIDWVSDCEYNLTIEEVTLPDFPFGKGTKMNIKVLRVRGNRVYYKSTLEGRTWEGKMKKIPNKS